MVRQDARDGDLPSKDQGRDGMQGRRVSEARLLSGSPQETRRLGALLGGMLAEGDVVLLTGDLGAGKTAFTQGIGGGLGVVGTINSLTFTLVKEYVGRLPLYHFDLYRIDEPDELHALGFEDYFGGDGVAVVEWAVRGEYEGEDEGGTIWPSNWLRVSLRPTPTRPYERTLDLAASGRRGLALLSEFLTAVEAARQDGSSTDSAPEDELRGAGAATEGA